MDKIVCFDVETISRKFAKPKPEMMFYKCFYVFKNLKNVFLEQRFKENKKTKKSNFNPRVSAQARAYRRLALGRKLLFWALRRPFSHPSAQFRFQLDFSHFQTLFLDILSPYPIILNVIQSFKT